MYKIFVALVFSLFFGVSSLVYAGFTGQSVTPSKVRDVKKMGDNTNVVLVGKTEKSLGVRNEFKKQQKNSRASRKNRKIFRGRKIPVYR